MHRYASKGRLLLSHCWQPVEDGPFFFSLSSPAHRPSSRTEEKRGGGRKASSTRFGPKCFRRTNRFYLVPAQVSLEGLRVKSPRWIPRRARNTRRTATFARGKPCRCTAVIPGQVPICRSPAGRAILTRRVVVEMTFENFYHARHSHVAQQPRLPTHQCHT